MIIDIRFKDGPPLQIRNLRRVSVYPNVDKTDNSLPPEPVLILYSKDDRVSPQYFGIPDIQEYWLTND